MKLWILQPSSPVPPGGRPGVLWIHGGGYITGMPEMVFFTQARSLAQRHGAVVISPGYRLAGKAP